MKYTKLVSSMAFFLVCCSCEGSEPNTRQQNVISRHALDPLSSDELEQGVDALKAANLLGNGWFLQHLSLAEPAKTPAGVYPDAASTPRRAFAVVLHPRNNERFECIVDLATKAIVSKTPIKSQPAVLDSEYAEVKTALLEHSDVIRAVGLRGITNMDDVYVDTWGPGELKGEGVDETHRILRSSFYLRGDSRNPYARPIEGVTAIYDVTLAQVVKVSDSGVMPMQPKKQDYFQAAQDEQAPPAGFSPDNSPIKVNGHEVSWNGWRFRYQMHPREGLVLYGVGRDDKDGFRSILDRVSLSEMVVPYSDPDQNWHWRAAFDEGDYGIGLYANSLLRGVHFPVDGLTFDAPIADNEGKVEVRQNVVAMFERSSGMLWSHYDSDLDQVAAMAGKELVVLFVFTVGNYDYGVQWIFKQDGSIQAQMLLTGMLLTKGHTIQKCERCNTYANRIAPGDRYGMVVDKNLVATAHQHFFNLRLDFAVDGPKNSVAEITLSDLDDVDHNPHGNAYLLNERLLKTERDAVRDIDHNQARHWWIFNRSKVNALGHYSGYALEPGTSAHFFAQPRAHTFQAAPFLAHPFYVTKYSPAEMHAAGDYPNQNSGEGIPTWIKSRNTPIVNEDLVVWYTVGVTHLPCAEEWPIMPVHRTGFTMKPMGFYTHNPTTDLKE